MTAQAQKLVNITTYWRVESSRYHGFCWEVWGRNMRWKCPNFLPKFSHDSFIRMIHYVPQFRNDNWVAFVVSPLMSVYPMSVAWILLIQLTVVSTNFPEWRGLIIFTVLFSAYITESFKQKISNYGSPSPANELLSHQHRGISNTLRAPHMYFGISFVVR